MNELLLFAKAPLPGLVKTRLAKSLGKDEACRAYELLLRTIASRLNSIPWVTVCYAPSNSLELLRPFFPSHWRFRPQQGFDLGARLHHAIATSFTAGAAKVAVIGSDCPYLNSDDIAQAWLALDQSDIVFGPALDGGYWLIGTNHPHAKLFDDIDWGTSNVLQQSLARAKSLGLAATLLRELSDIDTQADWQTFTSRSACDLH